MFRLDKRKSSVKPHRSEPSDLEKRLAKKKKGISMRIAIEAQRIFQREKHGMDFAVLEVLRQLQVIDKDNEYFVLVTNGPDRCLTSTPNMRVIELSGRSGSWIWEQLILPRKLKELNPDLLHCTSNTAPLFCPYPLVVTLHDIMYLEQKGLKGHSFAQSLDRFYCRRVVSRVLPRCRKIITVSKFESERIGQYLQLPPYQITYIHNGFGEHFRPMNDYSRVVGKYLNKTSYILFLGNTDPKKNTLRTLQAYERYLKQSTVKLPLLIADLTVSEVDEYLTEGKVRWIKPNLIIPGYIDNRDLPAIYSGAFAFLYTSLRESFGIPNLECMACGTPVITSDTSAIPEVVGERAIRVDPTDVNAIADALVRLEQDEIFYQQAVAYGLERVKDFSWRRSAEQTLSVYNNLSDKLL